MSEQDKRCASYEDHERSLFHRHVGPIAPRPNLRFRTRDGCSGAACTECAPRVGICEIVEIDCDGIPLDRSVWTEGDIIGDLIRWAPETADMRMKR